MTVAPFSSRGCTDFTDLVVDDDIALEGTQAFTIIVGSSTAMVNIIDDDGEPLNFHANQSFTYTHTHTQHMQYLIFKHLMLW